jgi:hypothetical protein
MMRWTLCTPCPQRPYVTTCCWIAAGPPRLNSAGERLQRAGVRGKVGRAYSRSQLDEFFEQLIHT